MAVYRPLDPEVRGYQVVREDINLSSHQSALLLPLHLNRQNHFIEIERSLLRLHLPLHRPRIHLLQLSAPFRLLGLYRADRDYHGRKGRRYPRLRPHSRMLGLRSLKLKVRLRRRFKCQRQTRQLRPPRVISVRTLIHLQSNNHIDSHPRS